MPIKLVSHRLIAPLLHSFVRGVPSLRAPFTSITQRRKAMDEHTELFEYTSGRWICNDSIRRSERRRLFNVSELKRLAAKSVNQSEEDVACFEKLAEGGFNRTFLITMRNNFQFVARIPYSITEPKRLVVASEVATMDFLRSHGLPIPKVYDYSATSENAAGTEYIFMELVHGKCLGDVWFDLSEKAMHTIIAKLVDLESRLFNITFPANGSLYYSKDLPVKSNHVEVPPTSSITSGRFCIGPDTTLGLWYGRRQNAGVDRGPYRDAEAALTSGARKEIMYLEKFGRPIYPFQRIRREVYKYQKQSHLEHIATLKKYLQIAPYIVPEDKVLSRPTLRHPDFQPNNIFISEDLEITGLIDWQHCTIMPLFLQCGIPNSFQNYGDDVSESLLTPVLPADFSNLNEHEQHEQAELLRRRQLHYFYVKATATRNPIHFNALTEDLSALRRKVFYHASDPWEGDNVSLKTDLIYLTKEWSKIIRQRASKDNDGSISCPIAFSEDEVKNCLQLHTAQLEADEQFEACRDVVGVGPEGWVPNDQYDDAKQRERKLKADALEAAESADEREEICENWIFDDFDEEDYL